MVFTNIQPFPTVMTPITNISPLTYRDASTFLEYLETIKQWLNETLVPDSNEMITSAIDEFQTGIANAEATVNEAKAGWQGQWNEWTTDKAAEYLAFVADIDARLAAFSLDIETTKTDWTTQWNTFMANVQAEIAAISDAAVGGLIDDPASATANALEKQLPFINVKWFGAVGDGVADDSAAIQAAINSAAAGATVYFPGTGPNAFYKVNTGLTLTQMDVRFQGQPRDAYAVSIRSGVAGMTILTVKQSGFTLENMGIVGDGGVNGEGSTVTGVDLFGTDNADIDCALDGATIQWCSVAVKIRGRNAFIRNSLFSNCSTAILIDGLDAVFHVGASKDSGNRGTTITNNRFHNTGIVAVDITENAKMRHALIADNYTDSNGNGIHYRAIGTAAFAHEKITYRNNKSAECGNTAYWLTYVNNSTIDGADIMGNTVVVTDANAIHLNNCNTLYVRNIFGVQIGGSGVYARNCTSLIAENIGWRVLGMGTGPAAHGFDIDSTNTRCKFSNVRVENTDGSGFSGSPTLSILNDHDFISCTAGNINSDSLRSHSSHGRNVYVEGVGGRKTDIASKSYDLVDGVTQSIAAVNAANAYTSFELEVIIIGRNSAGNCYAKTVRYIRPENGNPQYNTITADVVIGTLAISFIANGTTGVTVQATATVSNAFVTAHVRALAGGGASAANPRGVTVTMV